MQPRLLINAGEYPNLDIARDVCMGLLDPESLQPFIRQTTVDPANIKTQIISRTPNVNRSSRQIVRPTAKGIGQKSILLFMSYKSKSIKPKKQWNVSSQLASVKTPPLPTVAHGSSCLGCDSLTKPENRYYHHHRSPPSQHQLASSKYDSFKNPMSFFQSSLLKDKAARTTPMRNRQALNVDSGTTDQQSPTAFLRRCRKQDTQGSFRKDSDNILPASMSPLSSYRKPSWNDNSKLSLTDISSFKFSCEPLRNLQEGDDYFRSRSVTASDQSSMASSYLPRPSEHIVGEREMLVSIRTRC